MTRLLPLLLLLLATPAAAQSFYPNLAGSRYCQLRRLGIDKQQAMVVAMREHWASDREPVMVNYRGEMTSLDVMDFARWMVRCDGY